MFLKDIDDGLDRFAGYELVEDLMLNQVGLCSLLEFIQSRFKERSQLWRGMDRHGDEGTCRVVENRWRESGRKKNPTLMHKALGIMASEVTGHKSCYRIGMIDAQADE